MKASALKSMAIDEVIELKLQIDNFLNDYVRREQEELDRRLKQLSALTGSSGALSKDAGLLARLAESGLAKPRLASIQKALKGLGAAGKVARSGTDGRSIVKPKYRNPDKPYETWSGRGKRPRWLQAAMKTGKSLSYFEIGAANAKGRRSRK